MTNVTEIVPIRARALAGFVELVATHGGDAAGFVRAAGLDPAILETPDAIISLPQVTHAIDAAARDLAIPDFALQLAAFQDINVLGPAALAIRHSETVREALEAIRRLLPYHTPGASFTRVADADPAFVRLRYQVAIPDETRRHAVELSLAVAARFLSLFAPDRAGWRIELRHAALAPAQTYTEHFGCPVQFGANDDALLLPTALMSAPVDPTNAELGRIAERFVANVIRRHPLDIGQQVETLVARQLSIGDCTLPRIANQLGLHLRTLQRRLRSQDLHFEDIVDKVRRARALECLPHPTIPLVEVAALLGYTEQSSFHRACLRWHGKTPQSLRAVLMRTGTEHEKAVRSFDAASPHE